MTERYRHSTNVGYSYQNSTKMENEFTHKKTMIIVVIVVGCFAVLWPKVFYPMLLGSANQHMQPSAIDKTTGCCYVLSETDVDTIKIMSELCGNIIKEQAGSVPLTGKQIINICQDEVLKTCGIDISAVLQEQVRLGQSTKQILDEIRSLNGSLCFKYNFGVPTWRLGVPHIITLKNVSESVRQERPTHVRSEMVHPAFRERGRAIPEAGSPSRPPPRIVEGRPGPIPGMRPTMGGAGHVVAPSKQGTGSMGVIMPIYTIGIVIFFTYTLMKILFKKHPDTDTIYSTMDQDGRYRKDILGENVSRNSRDSGSCKLVVNAMSALLDEVDQEIEARRQASEVVTQDEHTPTTNLSNGSVKKEEKPSVKIMGMETSESCEGGKKWQSSNSSVLPSAPPVVNEYVPPPQEIYLDRALPPQSQILVTDSATETEKNSGDDPAVVLAGKMTLSVISLENEDIEIDHDEHIEDRHDLIKREIDESKPILQEEINNIIEVALDNLENKYDEFQIEEMKNEEASMNNSEEKHNESVEDKQIEEINELKEDLKNNTQKHLDQFSLQDLEDRESQIIPNKIPVESCITQEANVINEEPLDEILKHYLERDNNLTDNITKKSEITIAGLETQSNFQNIVDVEEIKTEMCFAKLEQDTPLLDKISNENLENNTQIIGEEIQPVDCKTHHEDKFDNNIEAEIQKTEAEKDTIGPLDANIEKEVESCELPQSEICKSDVLNIQRNLENSTEEVDLKEKSNDLISNEKFRNIDFNQNPKLTEKISEDLKKEFDDISKEIEALVDEGQSSDENKNISKDSDKISLDIVEIPIENQSPNNDKDVAVADAKTNILTSTENVEVAKTPLLNLSAKSSSEESGSTVVTVSNQGSIINLNSQPETDGKKEVDDVKISDEEESDVEYEVESEEEIEIFEEEDEDEGIVEEAQGNTNQREAETDERLTGAAVLINGTVPHNGTPEDEESDEEEIEEIIEYSEEEIEEESEGEANDIVHLSSNGNGGE